MICGSVSHVALKSNAYRFRFDGPSSLSLRPGGGEGDLESRGMLSALLEVYCCGGAVTVQMRERGMDCTGNKTTAKGG